MTEAPPASAHPTAADDERRSASWDIHAGPRNYLALLLTQGLTTILGFVSVWIMTHILGPSGYGRIAAIIAASQAVAQLGLNWSSQALYRYGCEEFVQTGRLRSTFLTRLLVLIINLLAVLCLAPWWFGLVGSWLHIPRALFVLVLVHLSTTVFWLHTQRTLQAAKLPRVQAVLLTTERTLGLTLIGLIAVCNRASVYSFTLALVAGSAIPSAIGLCRLRALVFPLVYPKYDLLKDMLVFSLPLIPFSLFGYLSSGYTDAFFISRFLSTAHLGVYMVAYQLAGPMLQLPVLLGSLLLPFFVTLRIENEDRRITSFLREVVPLLTYAASILYVLFVASAGHLIPKLFGHRFHEVEAILWPLTASAALNIPWAIGYGPAINARSATVVFTIAATVTACVNLGLDLLLIPRFGLVGCAWATAAAAAADLLVGICYLRLRIPNACSWTVQAALPALVAAAWASRYGSTLGSLLVALVLCCAVGFLNRRSLAAGAAALLSSGICGAISGMLSHRRLGRCRQLLARRLVSPVGSGGCGRSK